jgi:DNA-binding HxlR family transcriptional regulator
MKLEKITKSNRRSYEDACSAAHALDLVGERWALLVMRELMFGPRRFSDIKADLPGISANVLTQRLEGLEAAGVVARRRLPPPASAQVYELTAWGYEAEPIFMVLGRWASRSPLHDPTLAFSAVSLMLSFRTMFDTARAGDLAGRLAFRIGEHRFVASVEKARLAVERSFEVDADVTVTGTASAIAACVYGGQPLAAMEQAGALAVEGERALLQRFLPLFPLPPKIDAGEAQRRP